MSVAPVSPSSADAPLAITIDDVRAARKRIAQHAHVTPVLTCQTMNRFAAEAAKKAAAAAGNDAAAPSIELFFKCENFQRIGAFKIRGALNAVHAALESREPTARQSLVVVTHSSGNHAQALAHAATLAGLRSVIVMPTNAPRVKVEAVQGYGGEVVWSAPNQAAREAGAAEQVAKHAPNSLFIAPYDDARVMAGQGTLALELLEQAADLDALIVPVGGGGMLSGVCVAAKAINPQIRIYGAEPALADDAFHSIRSGVRTPLPAPTSTVADGLRTSLGLLTFPVLRRHLSGVLTVSEEDIVRATKLVFERMKIVIEPSAGVGVAAALSALFHTATGASDADGRAFRDNNPNVEGMAEAHKRPIRRVGIVLCGGNVDLDELPWVVKKL